MEIIAEFLNKNGYDGEPKEAVNEGLNQGERYLVTNIQIGQSHSYVELKGFERSFNTVMFEFYDLFGKKVNIFETKYNPYRRK